MKAYKCERCGALYNIRNDRSKYLIYRPNKNAAARDIPVNLCEECSNELIKWFSEKKKEAET